MPIVLRLRSLQLEEAVFIEREACCIKGKGQGDPGVSGLSSEVLSKSALSD
jgi:hypothetical protein